MRDSWALCAFPRDELDRLCFPGRDGVVRHAVWTGPPGEQVGAWVIASEMMSSSPSDILRVCRGCGRTARVQERIVSRSVWLSEKWTLGVGKRRVEAVGMRFGRNSESRDNKDEIERCLDTVSPLSATCYALVDG